MQIDHIQDRSEPAPASVNGVNGVKPGDPRPGGGQHSGASSAGQIDFLKLAWRYRILLVLGLLVGLGWGYYQHIQQPIYYRSSAQVQIVEPVSKALPVEGLESGTKRRSLDDEAMVMRSEAILRNAADLGELDQTPEFKGKSAESIAVQLANKLKIQPVALKANSSSNSIFEISFDSGDPTTTNRVVQSVIDAYAEHLQSHYSNVGEETINLIQSARTEVLERLEELEKEFDEFRQASPLVFRGGQAASIHRENADQFLAQKQTLVVRKMQLETTLRVARESLDAGEPVEAVLIALSGQKMSGASGDPETTAMEKMASAKARQVEKEMTMPQSAQVREERLVPLEVRYNELLQKFGSSHPSVRSMKVEMDLVRRSIDRMEAAEAEYDRKMREVLGPEEARDPNNIDPKAMLKRSLQLQILALRQQLHAVEEELEVFDSAYQFEVESAKSESSAEMRMARYERDIARQQSLYDRIVARLDEINIVVDSGGLRLFTLQSPKKGAQITTPISKSLLMGGFLGLMLAGGLAYVRELSDKSYRSAEQVAEHLGMPVIGHVPVVKPEKKLAAEVANGYDPHLVSFYRPKSSSSEAFKAIRTAVYFSNRSGDYKVIQITSPTPGDGKSTVAANLAITMAQSGKSVLLIDTDLRRPRVQKLFGIEQEQGLAWLLDQLPKMPTREQVKERLGEVITESDVDNLSVIGAGARPDNPSELLSSSRFDATINTLRGLFDIVIIDSPPLLAVTDPSTVASRVDAVMLVVRIRKIVKPLAARASRMLETLEANVVGTIINGVGSREAKGYGKYADTDGYYNRGRYYQYGYGYSYGSYDYGKYKEYYADDKKKGRRSAKTMAS